MLSGPHARAAVGWSLRQVAVAPRAGAGAARAPPLHAARVGPVAHAARRGPQGQQQKQQQQADAPPDVAPEVLLSLQERRVSGSEASTSVPVATNGGTPGSNGAPLAPAAAIAPRTRLRLARTPNAPGYRPGASPAAGGPSAVPGGAAITAALGAAAEPPVPGSVGALLQQHGVAGLPPGVPWAQALRLQLQQAAAAGRAVMASPDPSSALVAWLLDAAARPPASRPHWLAVASVVEAMGGPGVLPLPVLEQLLSTLAASAAADLAFQRGADTTAASPAAAVDRAAARDAWKALLAARSSYVAAICEQLQQRLETAGTSTGGTSSSGDGGGGGAETTAAVSTPPDVSRTAAILSSLFPLAAAPPPSLLQALLTPVRGSLPSAPPAALGALGRAAADLGAPLRASWLAEFRAAAVAAAKSADGSSATDLLWALARYQQGPPEPDAYHPILLAIQRGAAGLLPGDVHRALLAAERLGVSKPDGWAEEVIEASAVRLGEASSLSELAEVLQAASEAIAPQLPSREWAQAFAGAAVAVAERGAPPQRQQRQPRDSTGAEQEHDEEGQEQQQHRRQQQQQQQQEGEGKQQRAQQDAEVGIDCTPLTGGAVVALFSAVSVQRWFRPRGGWVARVLSAYARCPLQPGMLPQLLQLTASLLPDPASWGKRNRGLLTALIGGSAAEAAVCAANPRQLGAIAEAAAALEYRGPNCELLYWIGSAALRLGRGCPLQQLTRIQEAFATLGFRPRDSSLIRMLNEAKARQATVDRKRAEREALKRHVYLKKRGQLYNKLHRARLRALKRLRFGMGWRATAAQAKAVEKGLPVEATWWQRKLKPPGKMKRRF